MFHVRRGEPYHRANSRRGVLRASRLGYRWIDLDCRSTADGVLVVCHWPRPMVWDRFSDPLGRVSRHTPVERMTWDQVRRLRAPGHYRISRAENLIKFALDHGLRVELELKPSRITRGQLRRLHQALGDRAHLVQVKAVNTNNLRPRPWVRLAAAKDAGFVTILSGRNRPAPAAAKAWIDFTRGRVKWTGGDA